MHSLSIIKDACIAALDDDEEPSGRSNFRSIADPQTVLELVQIAEKAEKGISEEELRALGKLIRDLTGYINMNGGTGPGPVRDDLLLQARQLMGVTGI
jgi:hypothetical protein